MATPKESIPAYGALHSTGSILRGHACGNAFNMADATEVINLHADNVVENQKRARFTSTFLILAQQRLMSLNPLLPPLSMTLTSVKKFKLLWNVALEIILLFIISDLYLFVIIYSSYYRSCILYFCM